MNLHEQLELFDKINETVPVDTRTIVLDGVEFTFTLNQWLELSNYFN